MNVTLKDIARETGLSFSTVAEVLRDPEGCRQATDTRQKVLDTAARMGYRRNVFASTLRSGKSRTIGILTGEFPGFEMRLRKLQAIDSSLAKLGFRCIPRTSENDSASIIGLLNEFADNRVQGIVVGFCLPLEALEVCKQMTTQGIQIVSLEESGGVELDCVAVDRRYGSYLAVKHLMDLGHRRIALLLSNDNDPPITQRVDGYTDAFEEFGLAIDEDLVVRRDSHNCINGYESAREILKSGKGVTALFCEDDLIAIGAMRAVTELGLRIPEDISVIGFDNIEVSTFTRTPLTTVAQPVEELAARTVELLTKRIANPATRKRTVVEKIVPKLLIRDSTGERN